MTTSTRKILARRYMGLAYDQEYVTWAVGMLVEGYDTPILRILAGLSFPFASFEIDVYFSKTLVELGITIPDRETCLRTYALDVARGIVNGDITPEEGCHTIFHITQDLLTSDLRIWLYLDDKLDPEMLSDIEGDAWAEAVRKYARKMLY